MVMPVGCDLTWVDRMPASRDASRFRTCASWLAAQRPHGTRYAPQAHSEFCAHPSPVHMRLLAARSHHPLVSCVMQLSLTRAKPEENEIAAKRHRGTPTVATRAGAHVFPASNEPLAESGACRRCELCPVAGMANIGLCTTREREGEGVWGRGEGRGGEGRDHHVNHVAHLAQEHATPKLKTIPRSFELRAHVYASLAHASAHPDIRTVRGLSRT